MRDRLLAELLDEPWFDRSGLEGRVERALLAEGRLWPRRKIRKLSGELSDELFGMGPLEGLMREPEVSEIMVNGPANVFVERRGRIEPSGVSFESAERIIQLVRRVLGPLNLRLDDTSPMVDARLPDGSRLNAVIPPLSVNGPAVTIRRFRPAPFTLRELIVMGSVGEGTAAFLERAVRRRANIVISGGASSGKTTLLNVLASFIPAGERIVTIEDAAELRIDHPHVLSLESRPANAEGRGEVTVRQLLRNALRMRPDRIIVGEVRGAEALDMLQAMNTGHPGSLGTAHANSPLDLLSRLETMALMSDVKLDNEGVRRQVSGALDLIVHVERDSGGRRAVGRVVSVSRGEDGGYDLVPVEALESPGPPGGGGRS